MSDSILHQFTANGDPRKSQEKHQRSKEWRTWLKAPKTEDQYGGAQK
jgi:hypothetical protein